MDGQWISCIPSLSIDLEDFVPRVYMSWQDMLEEQRVTGKECLEIYREA